MSESGIEVPAVDVAGQTDRLLAQVHQKLADLKSWHAGAELESIRAAAEGQETFEPVRSRIREALETSQRITGVLEELLKEVRERERREIRLFRFGPKWWTERRKELQRALTETPEQGATFWLETFADALTAWRLEDCAHFLGEEWPLPEPHSSRTGLLRQGIRALQEKRYTEPRLAEMLKTLIEVRCEDGPRFALASVRRAELLVLLGRIRLHHHHLSEGPGARGDDPALPPPTIRLYLPGEDPREAARAFFDQARELNPSGSLPLAALGEYYRDVEQPAEAEVHFRRAIEAEAAQPDGYLGLAACASADGKWEEADESFRNAVRCVVDDRDPLGTLSRLLAPVNGRACLRLAEQLAADRPASALESVNRALDLTVEGPNYPDSEAYQLKGDLLASAGHPEDAADSFHQAGRRFNWRGEFGKAEAILIKARELSPGHQGAGWQLADARLMLSYSAGDNQRAAVRTAAETWEGVLRQGIPDSNHYWAYLTGALLRERESDFVTGDWRKRARLLLNAVALVERSLVLNESRGLSWALLTRYFGWLGFQQNAVAASAQAMDLDSSDADVARERLTILANSGDWSGAESLIQSLLESDSTDAGVRDLAAKVRAFVHQGNGRYAEAIELINELSGDDPQELWLLEVRGVSHRMMGDKPAAEHDFQLMARMAGDGPENTYYRGVAAFELERSDAIETLAPLLESPMECGSAAWLSLILHLRAGRPQKALDLLPLALEWTDHRVLGEVVRLYIEPLREEIDETSYRKIDAAARERLATPPLSTEEELLRGLRTFCPDSRPDTWEWVGIHAGLARLRADAGNAIGSQEIYRQLTGLHDSSMDMFPEALLRLEGGSTIVS